MDLIAANPLPYVAAAITVAAGIFGFFWAKSGEKNQVGGIGWAALVLIVASGAVAVIQTHSQGRKAKQANRDAAAASQKADQLSEELRRAQFMSSAALLTLVNGFDLSRPVGAANFLFEVPVRGERPVEPPGFVGPFPELPARGSAELLLNIDGTIYRRFGLTPRPGGGLRLRDLEDDAAPVLDLVRTADGFRFLLGGSPTGEITTAVWVAEPDLASPPDDIINAPDSTFLYGVETAATGQFRRLVSQLVRQRNYGVLKLNIPNVSNGEIDRITAGYESIAPSLVIPVPIQNAEGANAESCGTSRIRVPMRLREYARDPSSLTLELVSDLRGFRSEPCEGDP